MDSSSLLPSSKSRHTFLDLLSSALTEEDKNKLIHEYHQKNSLFNTGLMETYLAGEPLLLSLFLFLLFLSLLLFSLAVIITTCRFLGKCGGRRYQPFPISSHRFLFLLLTFIISWLLLASSTLNFILSTASFYGQRNPSQLVSVPIKSSLNLDYPDYESRGKRESILTALFNDPDYDFDKIDQQQDEEIPSTTTTTESSFVQETTRAQIPIGFNRDPLVMVTRNGDIAEKGQPRTKVLIDPIDEETDGEDDEEYIEGDDGEEEETTQRMTTVLPRTTVAPHTRPDWVSHIGEGQEWADILNRGSQLPVATTRRIAIQRVISTTERSTTTEPTTTTTEPSTTTTTTTTTTPVPTTTTTRRTTTTTEPTTTTTTTTTPIPTTTRRRTTTSTTTTTTTERPSTRRRTIPTTTTTTQEPPSTRRSTTTSPSTTRRIPDYPAFERFDPHVKEGSTSSTRHPIEEFDIDDLPSSDSGVPPPSDDYSLFNRFDPTLNGIPSITHSISPPGVIKESGDLPDYISFDNADAIPIQIGHIQQKGEGKSGRPNLSLLSHRRSFESLHTESYRSTNRFFALLLALVLIVATLPSLLIVVLGAMNYGRGSHPMDRSKISDMVGVLSVCMSLFIFFVVPLLLLYSTIGLLFSHTHHTLCPLVQPPTETLEDVILVMEGCARVQTPLIRMAQSSLLAAVSAFPVAVLLLQLSNYFLRMRREHYWTHSDSDLM